VIARDCAAQMIDASLWLSDMKRSPVESPFRRRLAITTPSCHHSAPSRTLFLAHRKQSPRATAVRLLLGSAQLEAPLTRGRYPSDESRHRRWATRLGGLKRLLNVRRGFITEIQPLPQHGIALSPTGSRDRRPLAL